jgi:hypothetical protein
VWDVLANGWVYSRWVVVNSHISSGLGLARTGHSHFAVDLTHFVLTMRLWLHSCVSGEELALLAKVRPAATARITLRLNDLPRGQCRVTMSAVPASRPRRWPDSVHLMWVHVAVGHDC